MFAIVKTGGKQYRVEPGLKLRVEKLEAEPGSQVELPVLLLGGEETRVGAPVVEGAKVVAEVLGHGRGKKITISRFKAKVQYRRKKGHRQPYTELLIKEIQG
ncbi:MAG: 50S ribosomal protein L21 [Thermus sp.]|uniref:50S ribosomal protein L21 n=1 Tax=unclassified Thermus TaxID=2619321 RepID=UPI00023891C8|nr:MULTISPECIES: 50S ribosomal protein L21 [unclassified Thermus]AEV17048.1 50S ribosomal protein L21 [Thermus sp. CCB_US3_UF1]MCS6869093.1 50S ribosomal protein L21 [Thermus sp.]MCS7217817.1 50S ribosomal protein L21 [Thermus sp.]MCX7849606.1 50S ribosomal protein L21 [Thermus sp.]MDW8016635.1 50S ribosomal protein L21 [Thermus sp.]